MRLQAACDFWRLSRGACRAPKCSFRGGRRDWEGPPEAVGAGQASKQLAHMLVHIGVGVWVRAQVGAVKKYSHPDAVTGLLDLVKRDHFLAAEASFTILDVRG